jgi:RNA polymerase sigma-70 factor (ECF subfamily)
MNIQEYNHSVDQFADGLYRFALKSIGDTEMARDFVQDAFEKLWVKIETVDYSKVKSYLFTTIYHAVVDNSRKQQRNKTYSQSLEANPSHEIASFDVHEVLEKGLNEMSEIQRNVVLLRDYEGYSYQEIGKITGLNEQQVKVYIFRARKFLKEYIGNIEAIL